jgi:RNA-directed DNA polymerase
MPQSKYARFTENLAAAFHAHNWTLDDLRIAAARATGKRHAWASYLIRRLLTAFTEKPAYRGLVNFLTKDKGFNRVCHKNNWHEFFPVRSLYFPANIPIPRPAWAPDIPDIRTLVALAQWLKVKPGRLAWLADPSGRNRLHPKGPLRTYRYRWVAKSSGRIRLLEIPTPILKRTQRKLLDDLLNLVPAHSAAHGFRSGRSAITNASPHCGRAIVIGFDLKDFFPSVIVGRVFALFRTLGYPSPVARLLAGLCTTRLPHDIWDARPNPAFDGSDHFRWQKFGARHLPQGVPTSPAIANLVAYRLDCRLSGLAAELDAIYTRYADDLTFSGGPELARCAKRLTSLVAQIVEDEGFTLNLRKTRVQSRAMRQTVTGIVVNARTNPPRAEFDQLKAILTNCIRKGADTQNREHRSDFRAHLMGKIAHFSAINPSRGQKLWELFDRIVWPQNDSKG